MIKKIIFIVLLILALGVVWYVYQSLKENSASNPVAGFFQTDFVGTISEQVTSGLSLDNETSPPEIHLEELGEFSPVAGLVTFVKDEETALVDDVEYEYLEIRANADNAEALNISNWSIQSLVSDSWYGIPQGVEVYSAGQVNALEDIYLRPGESAIIATKASPVGVSFRVNRCSGYLSHTQSFEPRLSTRCIEPNAVVPPTTENIKAYGDSCVQLAEHFPACTYLTREADDFETLSPECLERLQPRLTHNFCSGVHSQDSDFYAPKQWRVFLESERPIWKTNYEVIRLLDEKNRTVDVFSY